MSRFETQEARIVMDGFVKETPEPQKSPTPIKDPSLDNTAGQSMMLQMTLTRLAPHVTALMVKEMVRLRSSEPALDPHTRYEKAMETTSSEPKAPRKKTSQVPQDAAEPQEPQGAAEPQVPQGAAEPQVPQGAAEPQEPQVPQERQADPEVAHDEPVAMVLEPEEKAAIDAYIHGLESDRIKLEGLVEKLGAKEERNSALINELQLRLQETEELKNAMQSQCAHPTATELALTAAKTEQVLNEWLTDGLTDEEALEELFAVISIS
ncbi:hypothetical protein HYH03_010612 [Edaphochlamys debaryana]|uniref:Uncharacterized protein n=1 Tax=Edaphochlamys debaryana TaxID=47281 RepID=A0A835XW57_9CHLO|nr:hypothetical protein HYH03_010612 [Edaphochlamys debaryana]|eukprot:KAG2490935.1 hypothetical protein HYH03_010612 [Edaphochlamys debaryana]